MPLPQGIKLPPEHDHRAGVACPACDAAKAKRLEPKKFGLLYFKHAVEHWLKERASDGISPKMLKDYGYMKVPLLAFFGEFPLNEIHIGHVDSYVEMRLKMPRRHYKPAPQQAQLPHTEELNFSQLVGANAVRKEVSMLSQIMARAGLWAAIARDYKPPKMPKRTLDKVPEEADLQRLWVVACSNRRWKLAYWGAMVQVSTTCSHGEVRHIHLSDVDLAKRTLKIRDGLKNEHRDRICELNENAFWALGEILKRYFRLCKSQGVTPHPEHYILPGRTIGVPGFDFYKALGSWKKAWAELTEKAGLPGLQMRHCRHIPLTKLLENPELSERTIVEMAGHVSKNMWQAYSFVRRRPKQEAVKTLEFPRPEPLRDSSVETVEEVDIESNLQQMQMRKKV